MSVNKGQLQKAQLFILSTDGGRYTVWRLSQSRKELLDIYLANVDPFDKDGQFIDKGFSYTLAIYYQNEKELALAKSKIEELEKSAGKKAYIALEPFKSFYEAEEEHQDYYLKNPEAFEKEMVESGRRK